MGDQVDAQLIIVVSGKSRTIRHLIVASSCRVGLFMSVNELLERLSVATPSSPFIICQDSET